MSYVDFNGVGNSSWVHPEARAAEEFLANTCINGVRALGYSTKRVGKRTYDGNGHPVEFNDWYPVFVSRNELEQNSTTLIEARKRLRSQGVPGCECRAHRLEGQVGRS
jgi:hypothetical protein